LDIYSIFTVNSVNLYLKLEAIHFPVMFISTYFLGHKVAKPYSSSTKIFQKPRHRLKILGARRVTLSKFYTKDPEILGITLQNLVVRATWWAGFLHFCLTIKSYYQHIKLFYVS
jgi:hypothetical protein